MTNAKPTSHLNNTCEEYSLHKMKYLTLVFQAHLDLLCPALREIFLPLLLLTVLTRLLLYPNLDGKINNMCVIPHIGSRAEYV